jgi:dihydrofolate synthase/folylpolyglutamate synthase
MNADQRLSELFAQLTNFERTRMVEVAWSLATMHQLLDVLHARLGPRPAATRWIQIGGSKGKGTTALYVESLAQGMGLRTGVFTSPHLQHVTERIRIDGVEVAAEQLVEVLESVLGDASGLGLDLSFFEAMTLAAVVLFRAQSIDVAVFEVGLGGRLDATTAVPVDAAILTRIELEHTELLGDSVAAIAAEKAFVMRPERPVWFERQPATHAVLQAHAESVGALVQPLVEVVALASSDADWSGNLRVGETVMPFVLPQASEFELPALALAVGCLRGCYPEQALPLMPVPRPVLPGRFEVLPQADGWPFVLDGAHTPNSSAAVVAELQRRYPDQPVVALFATATDKLWCENLAALRPVLAEVFVTVPTGIPGADPAAVVEWLAAAGVSASCVESPGVGLQRLREAAAVRLVVGSFYLVGEARNSLVSR